MTVLPHWTRQLMTICNSLRGSMHSMQTTCPSSKSCRASWMSWSDRWWRFPSGKTPTSPWMSLLARLSFLTGTGKTGTVEPKHHFLQWYNSRLIISCYINFIKIDVAWDAEKKWTVLLVLITTFIFHWDLVILFLVRQWCCVGCISVLKCLSDSR